MAENGTICGGIDAGSRVIKIVLVHSDSHRVVASGMVDQGVAQNALATELFERLVTAAKLSPGDVRQVVATGYARDGVSLADTTMSEIACHGCGVHHSVPEARTAIEIGGQDSKILHLDDNGGVRDFAMNDRCAAGTGRFLEMVSSRLCVDIQDLGRLAKASQSPATISSMCVVFAETEITGLLATGTLPEDIVAGVQNSIASRVSSMAGRRLHPPVTLTGGVARVPGMAAALESTLGHAVTTAPEPQMTGALGAAILASHR